MLTGTQIGAYRVLEQIGSGGMGTVWLAEHVALGRRAAVKVLRAEYSAKPEIVHRFFNEARAASAITDPGIVQVFDFGEHVDGSAYLVMELLEGEPLDTRLERAGRLAIPDALRVMRQVANTLGAAHARGIVHRDLKPENIFLVRDAEVVGGERAKILDFGIAKLTGDAAGVKTSTQAIMGTPIYMSPEQCRGAGQVDQRSDVYSLGCVLYTLVVGRPPFEAEGVGEIIAMHLREPTPVPSSRATGIPVEVDRIVTRCMEKDPAQRFTSAAELALALGATIGSPTMPAPSKREGSTQPAGTQPTTLSGSTGALVVATRARQPRGVVIGVIVTLGIAGTAVGLVATRGTSTASEATPPVDLAAPHVVSEPAAPTARDVTTQHIAAVMASFTGWAKSHVGAPCPSIDAFAEPSAYVDGWGHPMTVTCTEQPDDQIIGVRSAGQDGAMGTADDLSSWTLDRDVTSAVTGPRWNVVPPAATVETTRPAPQPVATHTLASAPTPPPASADAATKPRKLKAPEPAVQNPTTSRPTKPGGFAVDENGIPISR
jgi:tRNA A-37 threonylcarbamoyl transferase component Bud32